MAVGREQTILKKQRCVCVQQNILLYKK